jgi:hypothetical protein
VYNGFFVGFINNSNLKISQASAHVDEEVDMPSLKDRLAAFNISDSSPDHSGTVKVEFVIVVYLNDKNGEFSVKK